MKLHCYNWIPAFAGRTLLKGILTHLSILIFFLLLQSGNSHAHPSLFFTGEEVTKGTEKYEEEGFFTKPTLSAILYIDENHWTIWINDKVIHPENIQELGEFQIEKVTPDTVELSSDVNEIFKLHPYQIHTSN